MFFIMFYRGVEIFCTFSENIKSSPNPFINGWFDHFDDAFFTIQRYDKGGKSLLQLFWFRVLRVEKPNKTRKSLKKDKFENFIENMLIPFEA